ncbi:hypothetical protein KDM41_11245 [bacterium]|nr:hypothetical protein [bacterium]
MSTRTLDRDSICDLNGQVLDPRSVTVLKALDRLLTVGAYYSNEHDQYLKAARDSRDALVEVIRGGHGPVAIEITAQGLQIDRRNVDPHHRNVRLLHDLLVPLNIARLEIDGALTPEDLRQAVAALQEHRMALGQASTFREIVIENLPASVRAVSRSVLDHGDAGGHGRDGASGAADGPRSLDDLLQPWSDEPADAGDTPEESVAARLARQFMEMVGEILANLQRADQERATGAGPDAAGTAVSRQELEQLRRALQRLVEIDPDPDDLLQLITQARRALDLSRDRRAADLVFRILKRDMLHSRKQEAGAAKRTVQAADYRLDVGGLLAEVTALESRVEPVAPPGLDARRDRLGIALLLLGDGPNEALRHALLDTVERSVAEDDFDEGGAGHLAAAVAARVAGQANPTPRAATGEHVGTADGEELLVIAVGTLRRTRSDLLAPFWVRLLELTGADELPLLWPHLVNDILLGWGKGSRQVAAHLGQAAGRLSLQDALGQGRRLAQMPALQRKTASRDLFATPLPVLYPVHAALMTTRLRGWLGQELHDALVREPVSPLAASVLAALGDHRPEYATFYLDLIRHRDADVLPADFAVAAAAILSDGIGCLPRDRRDDAWVTAGLAELAALGAEHARPLLERVLREKHFFFFPAWPGSARTVARRALTSGDREEG